MKPEDSEKLFVGTLFRKTVDQKKIEPSRVDKINKLISPDAFSNFVPNYKDLATVFQIFN